MSDTQFTERGFRIFATRERPQNEWLFGKPAALRVLESSIACRGAHVHVLQGDDNHVQLNVVEARLVAAALCRFCDDAEAGLLTEPASVDEEDDQEEAAT